MDQVNEPVTIAARHVLPETIVLVLLGGLDLITTLYLIATHQAQEANPLFGSLLRNYGHIGFIIAKALLLAIPLLIAEAARAKHPEFVKRALRMGVILYIGMYAISFAKSNGWILAQ